MSIFPTAHRKSIQELVVREREYFLVLSIRLRQVKQIPYNIPFHVEDNTAAKVRSPTVHT